eukprot:TRINITY_DN361_c0_g2_i7.p1 TRINITY_DN361_c0_g2~~TRINITY_DN361_c0_g2_i7.p1  ORF type:complete len:496 (+),score=223.86 TRINITY_DN361_c0_g2_i7:220-1707(+)
MVHVLLDDMPWLIQFLTYGLSLVTVVCCYFQEYFERLTHYLSKSKLENEIDYENGYAPLCNLNNLFFVKWSYRRVEDLFNRPVSGLPGAHIDVMMRQGDPMYNIPLKPDGTLKRCLNLGSYNYLGFAENDTKITDDVIATVQKYGTSGCSPRIQTGTTDLHRNLERTVADFVGKEEAIIFSMGYATNSTTIPSLVSKGDLIISDTLNHASIVVGCRSSGASIKVFKHNDPVHLEKVVRDAICEGQPRTHLPWGKILIVVEGIYSMEGEILKLREIIEVKKKYNCYLYVDEAHSIGAIGKTGRGISEYAGVNIDDIDIMMGTFTKSFASVGGYICSHKHIINHLRRTAFSSVDEFSMAPGCGQQVLSVIESLTGRDGTGDGARRLKQLADNVRFFRQGLTKRGFVVIGDDDSPVIPVMVIVPAKMSAFSRLCLERNVAVVIASYPATDLLLSRVRICVSAGHTRKDLEEALDVFTEVGDMCLLRYNKDSQYIITRD